MSRKKKPHKVNIGALVLTIVSAAVFVASLLFIVKYLIDTRHNAQIYEEFKQEMSENTDETASEMQMQQEAEMDVGNETLPEEEAVEIPVDFEGLKQENADIYAWITIPGTVIDYPVLQHPTDDTFYLNHNLDGSAGYPGCIYTESLNSKDFSDFNTVIYGHNMKDGTMFKGLHQYADEAFFDSHREVIIYTPEYEYHYTVFAAYASDDSHILLDNNFLLYQQRVEYLNRILNLTDLSAHIAKDVSVQENNRILTLSTCIASKPDQRYLVQAVQTECLVVKR